MSHLVERWLCVRHPHLGTWALVTLGVGCFPAPGTAHVLSVSHGNLQLEGSDVRYELRMPLAEAPVEEDQRKSLLDAFALRANGEAGERVEGACREEGSQQLYICNATYRFPEPPEKITVRCNYPSVTVPHHVHIVSSGKGDVARRTVFDIVSREAEIRFTAPTPWEVFTSQILAGVRRAMTSPELLLFLAILVLAGRTRRELGGCVGAFLLAQIAVALLGRLFGWTPPARFIEAAAALTVAYVAAEVLFLPEARKRWLVCAGMGCFHGLFLSAFLASTRMQPAYFVPGALGCEVFLLALLGALRLRFVRRREEQLLSLLLLVSGLGWFGLRLVN